MHVWVCNEEICPMDAHVLKDASIQCEFKGDRTKIKQVLSYDTSWKHMKK
jgi:hypothetical protein